MWLTALANALPALAKFGQDVIGHDDKAATAAKVAADPNAPPDVKQAAANVASKAIDASASAQKQAVQAAAGKAPQADSAGSSTMMLVGLGVLLLVMGKRR